MVKDLDAFTEFALAEVINTLRAENARLQLEVKDADILINTLWETVKAYRAARAAMEESDD